MEAPIETVLLHFPPEKEISDYLARHPLTQHPYLADKKIISAVAKTFANQERVPSSLDIGIKETLLEMNEQLHLNDNALFTFEDGLKRALSDCATQSKPAAKPKLGEELKVNFSQDKDLDSAFGRFFTRLATKEISRWAQKTTQELGENPAYARTIKIYGLAVETALRINANQDEENPVRRSVLEVGSSYSLGKFLSRRVKLALYASEAADILTSQTKEYCAIMEDIHRLNDEHEWDRHFEQTMVQGFRAPIRVVRFITRSFAKLIDNCLDEACVNFTFGMSTQHFLNAYNRRKGKTNDQAPAIAPANPVIVPPPVNSAPSFLTSHRPLIPFAQPVPVPPLGKAPASMPASTLPGMFPLQPVMPIEPPAAFPKGPLPAPLDFKLPTPHLDLTRVDPKVLAMPNPYKPNPIYNRLTIGLSSDPNLVFEMGMKIPLQKGDDEITGYINIGIAAINLIVGLFSRKKAKAAKELSEKINSLMRKLDTSVTSLRSTVSSLSSKFLTVTFKGNYEAYIKELEEFERELEASKSKVQESRSRSDAIYQEVKCDSRWGYRKKGIINKDGYEKLHEISTQLQKKVDPDINHAASGIDVMLKRVKEETVSAKKAWDLQKKADETAAAFKNQFGQFSNDFEVFLKQIEKFRTYASQDLKEASIIASIKEDDGKINEEGEKLIALLENMGQLDIKPEKKQEIDKAKESIRQSLIQVAQDTTGYLKHNQYLLAHKEYMEYSETIKAKENELLQSFIPFLSGKEIDQEILNEFNSQYEILLNKIDKMMQSAPDDASINKLMEAKLAARLHIEELLFDFNSLVAKASLLLDNEGKWTTQQWDKRCSKFVHHQMMSKFADAAVGSTKYFLQRLLCRSELDQEAIAHAKQLVSLVLNSTSIGACPDELMPMLESLSVKHSQFMPLLGMVWVASEKSGTNKAEVIFKNCLVADPQDPMWPAALARFHAERLEWHNAEEYILATDALDPSFEFAQVLKTNTAYDQYRLGTLYTELFQLFAEIISNRLAEADRPKLARLFRILHGALHLGSHPSILKQWLPHFIPTLFKKELVEKLSKESNILELSNALSLFQRTVPYLNELVKASISREKHPIIRGISRLTAQGVQFVQTGTSIWSAGSTLFTLKNKKDLELLDRALGIPLAVINSLSAGISIHGYIQSYFGGMRAAYKMKHLNVHALLGALSSQRSKFAITSAELANRYHEYTLRLSHRWTANTVEQRQTYDRAITVGMAAIVGLNWFYQTYAAWFESKQDIALRAMNEQLDTNEFNLALESLEEARKAGYQDWKSKRKLIESLDQLDHEILPDDFETVLTGVDAMGQSRLLRKLAHYHMEQEDYDAAKLTIERIKPLTAEAYIFLARLSLRYEPQKVNDNIAYLQKAERAYLELHRNMLERDASQEEMEWAKKEALRAYKCMKDMVSWQEQEFVETETKIKELLGSTEFPPQELKAQVAEQIVLKEPVLSVKQCEMLKALLEN